MKTKQDIAEKFNRQIMPPTVEIVGGEITEKDIDFKHFFRSSSGFSRSIITVRGIDFRIKGGGKSTSFHRED